MLYTQDITACLSSEIGDNGLDPAILAGLAGDCGPALDAIARDIISNKLPFLGIARATQDFAEIEAVAERYCETFDDILMLGTGGSSLGGRMLVNLAPPASAPAAQGALIRPRLHFMDNVDPTAFDRLFSLLDPMQTGVIAISKSGATIETLSQVIYCLNTLIPVVDAGSIGSRFTAITEPGDTPLRSLAEKHGFQIIDHHPDIPGRFSVLSSVGLLPAMISGVDGEALRDGAATALDHLLATGGSAPAEGAAVSVGLARERGATISVLMPYLNQLLDFNIWHRQLWAESLGKEGQGTTPVPALGTVDQHSQLQLYLDGPKDKYFTTIGATGLKSRPLEVDEISGDPRLGYLAGRSLADVLNAERRATEEMLTGAGLPVRRISIDHLDERALGALITHFMLETILTAHLMGVDPYGQPAVEEGKARAQAILAAGEAS